MGSRFVCMVTLGVAFASLPLGSASDDLGDAVAYEMRFAGAFQLYPLQGEGLTDELVFAGVGDAAPFGQGLVAGSSLTQNGPDGCAAIVEDAVTVWVAGGTLSLVNEGVDCVNVVERPGHVLIRGSGTTRIVGGTGAFDGATGEGTWSVTAEVMGAGVGHLDGTFDPLVFTGDLELVGA